MAKAFGPLFIPELVAARAVRTIVIGEVVIVETRNVGGSEVALVRSDVLTTVGGFDKGWK